MFALFEEVQSVQRDDILFSLVSYDNSRESSSSATFFNGITNSKWRLYLEETTFHRLFFIPSPLPLFFPSLFPFKSVLLMDDFFSSPPPPPPFLLFFSFSIFPRTVSDGKIDRRWKMNGGTGVTSVQLWDIFHCDRCSLFFPQTFFFPPIPWLLRIRIFMGNGKNMITFNQFRWWICLNFKIIKYQIYV